MRPMKMFIFPPLKRINSAGTCTHPPTNTPSLSTTLAGSDVTPLRRSYRTGETVLQSLNKLHGYDETKVYTGIHTRKVSPLPPPTLYLLCCIVSAAP